MHDAVSLIFTAMVCFNLRLNAFPQLSPPKVFLPHHISCNTTNIPAFVELRLLIYPFLLMPKVNYNDARTIFVKGYRGSSSLDYGISSLSRRDTKDIWPDILRTCRLINQEASPFIRTSFYRGNIFSFSLSGHGEKSSYEDNLTGCRHVFDSSNDCSLESPSTEKNMFARFLARIGPEAAKEVCFLRFTAADCDILTWDFPTITALCEAYLPGLLSVDISVSEAIIHYDESPDYYHPDCSSPFWTNGEFWPMYEAVECFTDKIGWLRRLKYDEEGQINFGSVDRGEVTGIGMLRRLEAKVKERKGKGVAWIGLQPQKRDARNRESLEDSSRPTEGEEENGDRLRQDRRKDEDHEIDDLLEIMGASGFP